jgi:hypothetical protein
MFVFNGARTAPTKSYVLLFDQTTQKATLERLDSTYTFNLATKNGVDISAQHTKLYPKKPHKDSVHDRDEGGDEDLFGEQAPHGDEGTDPDATNPYDFRHFLNAVKSKKGDEADKGYASSPDARAATPHVGSATATPPAARQPVQKKRKAASVFAARPTAKPAAAAAVKKTVVPTVQLERKATAPSTTTSKSSAAAAGSSGSKIKSAEFVQDSSEEEEDVDVDAEGELDSGFPSPVPAHSLSHSRSHTHNNNNHSSDNEAEDDSDTSDLEIHIPDTNTATHLRPHTDNARRRSPSAGPISLASAATSVAGTPRQGRSGAGVEEIDFGDLGGEEGEEEEEFEEVGTGGRERERGERKSVGGNAGGGTAAEGDVDEDDPLFMEMMEGLAGGESSEESEEE